ncbi:MAG TPA: hypothetical protein VG843_00300 [Rhizomicrobium sp.]|nr:hypothetical protein [Rhizomicrobium sp.]
MGIRTRSPLEGEPKNSEARERQRADARNFSAGGRAAHPSPKFAARISTLPQGEGGIVRIARTWIGTPYVHQASVKGAGCDCLGLLRGVWRELYGDEPEDAPPYSPDWAEATGRETLREALARHMREIDLAGIVPGDVALFRMHPRGPAKHCGIVAQSNPPLEGGSKRGTRFGEGLTLIHARQNKRVSEEPFSDFWRKKLAFAFRI